MTHVPEQEICFYSKCSKAYMSTHNYQKYCSPICHNRDVIEERFDYAPIKRNLNIVNTQEGPQIIEFEWGGAD